MCIITSYALLCTFPLKLISFKKLELLEDYKNCNAYVYLLFILK